MIKKIKDSKRTIGISLLILVGIMISFFIIYKLSSSLFLVIIGSIILLIASFIKDPEIKEVKNEELNTIDQLTQFSKEILEPTILNSNEIIDDKPTLSIKKVSKKKKNNTINIENTGSYKFDNNYKKIKKAKKLKI